MITLRKLIESCKDMDDDALDAELWVRVGVNLLEKVACVAIAVQSPIKEIPEDWDVDKNRFYLEGDLGDD